MRYLFVLGRNLELSIAEVLNFLKRFGNPAKKYSSKKNSILVEVNKKIENNAIKKLGGVIAIGEVIEDLDKAILYSGTKNKLNYVIWNFSENIDKFANYLKNRFKEERLKAVRKPLTGNIDSQDGKKFRTIGSKLIDEQYFVFNNFFGKIIQSCNYEELEKRDMQKPVRRESLSISPRLSKIMINLSLIKKGKLIDPFCGIGVILSEALLQEIKVIGIDIDEEALKGAKRNLKWGEFKEENYKLIKVNSNIVRIKGGEVIVTEPYLGKVLKKTPQDKEIDLILRKFEKLIIGVLNNLKKQVSGRIVFTSPYIKKKSCNINEITSKTGLKLIEGPFLEFRKNQVVGRGIFVLSR